MIFINSLSASQHCGICQFYSRTWPCQLGKAGRTVLKREGDHKSPMGAMQLTQVFYRPDRCAPPQTLLPVTPLSDKMGWCDDPQDRNYNRVVSLPYPASHEKLWRDDHVYDIIVVLNYNIQPRSMNFGSAVFMHLSTLENSGTEGCIALAENNLRQLLSLIKTGEKLFV